MYRTPLSFDRKRVLETVERKEVESHLILHATELALLGRIHAARDLATIHEEDVRPCTELPPELDLAWETAGVWPGSETHDAKKESELAELRQRYEEASWYFHQLDVPHEYTESVLHSLLDFDEQFQSSWLGSAPSGMVAITKTGRLIKALEISLQLAADQRDETGEMINLADLDARSASIVKEIAHRWGACNQREDLFKAWRLWPHYRDGMLATAFNFDPDELQRLSSDIVDTYRTRLRSPDPPDPFAAMPLRDLLNAANTNTLQSKGAVRRWIEHGEIEEGATARPGPPLFHPPASDEEIHTLEARLGVTLPADFQDFLRMTNGFGIQSNCNPNDQDGIFNSVFCDPPIRGSDAIKWEYECYLENLGIKLLELPGDIWSGPARDADNNMLLATFDRVLSIGSRDIDNLWLIEPASVARARAHYRKILGKCNDEQRRRLVNLIERFAGSMEAFDAMDWCFIKWSSGGAATMTGYPNFRAYLNHVTKKSGEDSADLWGDLY